MRFNKEGYAPVRSAPIIKVVVSGFLVYSLPVPSAPESVAINPLSSDSGRAIISISHPYLWTGQERINTMSLSRDD